MATKNAKHIRRVLGILLSLSIVAAGICLCAACVGIYRTGDHPFSREVVAEAFSGIAFPVYLCLGLVIAAFTADLFLPGEKGKRAAAKQNSVFLKRLHSRIDLSLCDEGLRSAVSAQQRSRRLHRRVTGGLLVFGSAVFLIYALQEGSFHQSEINGSMIRAMGVLLPCMLLPFGYGIFTVYRNNASMEKEIALLKQAETKNPTPAPSPADKPNRGLLIRNVILAAAIGCLIFGFLTGGTADVLTKAVNICTECVGLG